MAPRKGALSNAVESHQSLLADTGRLDAIAQVGDEAFQAFGVLISATGLFIVRHAGVEDATLGCGGLAVGEINDFVVVTAGGFADKIVEITSV